MTNSSYRPRSKFYREADHDNRLEPHPRLQRISGQMDEFLLNLFARTWDYVEKDTQICHMYGNGVKISDQFNRLLHQDRLYFPDI